MDDAATPFVRLLGAPQVSLGPHPRPFPPDKRHQLLAYLAYQGAWVGRRRLAFLFWPDEPEGAARRNLRRLLHRVRELGWLSGLAVQEERLSWAVSTDVTRFEAAVQGGRWAEALGQYGGALLEGLDGSGTGEFATWLVAERERLRGLWHSALLRRAQELEGAGDPGGAAALLVPLLGGDEFDEEVLGVYMRASSRAGRAAQALKAYADFSGRLHREFGLSPAPATERLARSIEEQGRMAVPAAVSLAPPTLPALPVPSTPLVGRELELAEVAHALGRVECRLLTLTGPGGAGKTRIALEAARELGPQYPGGAGFVPLAALDAAERLPITVAEALGLTLWGTDPPVLQVIRHLGASPRLLVLDNYEHLLDGEHLQGGAPFVADLLRGCPELRVLVTSRERLHLSGEWLLPVDGLPVPPEGTGLEEALTYDAVRLFVERVTRVRPGYVLDGEDLPPVLGICRLVGGLPLALELAAVWVRAVSPREIAAEIAASLDFLTSDARDVDARHASLRATFEHSWRLLTPAEQQVLRQLSVCEGGFRRDAARDVAGASLPLLASLLDQSLLRASPAGRYHRHPLLHGYTRGKLAAHPGEEREARARHGAHYLGLLRDQAGALRGPGQMQALARLDEDLENVRAAWNWAVEEGRAEDLGRACGALATHHDRRARYGEGVDLLGRAADALEGSAGHPAALARLRLEGAWLLYRLGRLDEVTRWAERGLALARSAGDEGAVMLGLNVLGALCWRGGEYGAARDLHREAAARARERDDRAGLGRSLHLLAIAEADGGNVAAAERDYRAALDLCRALGHHAERATVLNNLGGLLDAAGRSEEAVALFEEGLGLSRALSSPHLTAHLLASLGQTLYGGGDLSRAQAVAQEALDLARRHGAERLAAMLEVDLGRVATALGGPTRARGLLRSGLATLWAGRELPDVLRTLLAWAEWQLARGESAAATDLLRVIICHPATRHADRELARRLWTGPDPVEGSDPPSLTATVAALLAGVS